MLTIEVNHNPGNKCDLVVHDGSTTFKICNLERSEMLDLILRLLKA